MSTQYVICPQAEQVPPYEPEGIAQGLAAQLGLFLAPLVMPLDRLMDKRLLRTLVQTVQVIIAFRDRVNGLLLSELGGYLERPDKAPAGTKRLSNLLHSPRWKAKDVDDFLWQQASQQVEDWQEQGETALAVWDSSEWEKPETQASPDLCAVRSSKAKRLTHYKPGYFNPPRKPICVPGLHWLAVLLVGLSSTALSPKLAVMRWWTKRGPYASFQLDEQGKLLAEWLVQWGRKVIHVFDQGFASSFWLGVLLGFQLRFILRFKRKNCLLDAMGNRKLTWRIAQGKRGWEERTVWDSRRGKWVRNSVLALPVFHPDYPDQLLWLVVCRSAGRLPWYLLTAEPIRNKEDAWRIMCCYARRWHIEQTWRYDKSELGFQSPRLWDWDVRLKLLALASLAYAFLLELLHPHFDPLRTWLLRTYCHRTGWHLRRVKMPLYRLRSALSRLWQEHPPAWFALSQLPTDRGMGFVLIIEECPSRGLLACHSLS